MKKFVLLNLKREWAFYLCFALLLSIIGFFITCVTYDETRLISYYGSIYKMSSHDQRVYQMIGLKGITLQSYLFPLIVLCLIFFVFCVFFSYISCDGNRKYIFLLKQKGDSFIELKNSCIHFSFFLFSSVLAIGFYGLILLFFNLWANMQIPLFVFSNWVILVFFILNLYFLFVYVYLSHAFFSDKNRLLFLREEY